MVSKYKEGDKVYFVSSSVFVKEATVIRSGGGFVTIKFATNNGNDGPSGIRVRESKVYRTEEEANKVVQMNKARQGTVESYNDRAVHLPNKFG